MNNFKLCTEFVEMQKNPIAIVDIDKNILIDANSSFANLFTLKDIDKFKKDLSLFYSKISNKNSKIFKNSVDFKEYLLKKKNSSKEGINILIKQDNNKKIYLKVLINVLSSKITILTFVHISDIQDETKRVEKKISFLEEYKEAVDHGAIVSKADLRGIITYINDSFCEISGYSKEELIGSVHSIIRHPNMDSAVFRQMWKTITSGNTWSGLIENRAKDGKAYYVDSIIMPIVRKEQICEYIAIGKNVTKLIEEENAFDKMRLEEWKHSIGRAKEIKDNEILNSMPFASIILTSNNTIVNYNEAFISIFDIINAKDKISAIEKKEANFSDIATFENDVFNSELLDWKESLEVCDSEGTIIDLDIGAQVYKYKVFVKKYVNKDKHFIVSLIED